MASHELHVGTTDEWYTPAWVFEALRIEFDMDAASPGATIVPWIPAREHITRDALSRPWSGSVWLNPPYGGRNGVRPWLGHVARFGSSDRTGPKASHRAAATHASFAIRPALH